MPKMFSADDLTAMERVRHGIDPAHLSNPGKLFPTPRLCGEVPGPYRRHPVEHAGLAERLKAKALFCAGVIDWPMRGHPPADTR